MSTQTIAHSNGQIKTTDVREVVIDALRTSATAALDRFVAAAAADGRKAIRPETISQRSRTVTAGDRADTIAILRYFHAALWAASTEADDGTRTVTRASTDALALLRDDLDEGSASNMISWVHDTLAAYGGVERLTTHTRRVHEQLDLSRDPVQATHAYKLSEDQQWAGAPEEADTRSMQQIITDTMAELHADGVSTVTPTSLNNRLTALSYQQIRSAMLRLEDAGELTRVGRGDYRLAGEVTTTKAVDDTPTEQPTATPSLFDADELDIAEAMQMLTVVEQTAGHLRAALGEVETLRAAQLLHERELDKVRAERDAARERLARFAELFQQAV